MSRKLTNEIVDQRLKEQNREHLIKRKSDIIKCIENNLWECLINTCNFIWEASPHAVINHKTGCPKCAKTFPLTNEIVDQRLKDNNRKLIRIGNIINANTNILWECTVCRRNWEASPNNVLNNGSGCPKCKFSKGILKIEQVLLKLNLKHIFEFSFENCKGKRRKLPFDVAVFDINNNLICLIEYDGRDHFFPVNDRGNPSRFNRKNYNEMLKSRKIKQEYCNNNGINLIEIPFWEFDNIETIIKSLT